MRSRGSGCHRRTMSVMGALGFGLSQSCSISAPSDRARAQFDSIIQNVKGSSGHIYDAKDDGGNTCTSASIVPNPKGGYVAVYHTYIGNSYFAVSLGTSQDLLHWRFVRQLGQHASQPCIFNSNGHFIVAWEQDPNNHIQFRWFNTIDDLLNGVVAKTYDAPDDASPCAEGTPNIYSVRGTTPDNVTVSVGCHYYRECKVDRQAQGTMKNFRSWSSSDNSKMNNAIEYWGVKGNIGQRSSTAFKGHQFALIEGMKEPGNWATWGLYTYDYETGNADKLTIATDKGTTAFANPRVEVMNGPNGSPAVVWTMFVPGEGAAEGEGGEVICYTYIGATANK